MFGAAQACAPADRIEAAAKKVLKTAGTAMAAAALAFALAFAFGSRILQRELQEFGHENKDSLCL